MTNLKSTPGVTADDVLAYVAETYVSIEHLAAETQISAARIAELIAAECVPPHAYDITGEIVISSAFGSFCQPMTPRRAYPPSLAAWISRAEPLAREIGLKDAARQIRTEFLAPIAEALPDRWPGGRLDAAARRLLGAVPEGDRTPECHHQGVRSNCGRGATGIRSG